MRRVSSLAGIREADSRNLAQAHFSRPAGDLKAKNPSLG
jgi:hypothetical protein